MACSISQRSQTRPHGLGGTENGGVDVIFHDLLFHVGKIHPPDTLLVLCQRRVDNVIAIVRQAVGKANVGRAVEQHVVPFGAQNVQRGDHAAQYAVFVADVFRLQAGDAVARFVPADDGIIIFIGRTKIAKGRVLGALDNGLLDGRYRGKIHIRHPHWIHLMPIIFQFSGFPFKRICPASVNDFIKFIFHSRFPPFTPVSVNCLCLV